MLRLLRNLAWASGYNAFGENTIARDYDLSPVSCLLSSESRNCPFPFRGARWYYSRASAVFVIGSYAFGEPTLTCFGGLYFNTRAARKPILGARVETVVGSETHG